MRIITTKILKYYPSGVAIICVEKLHWQVANAAVTGGKKPPTYHVIW